MSKHGIVVSLTSLLNPKFELVKNENAAFGYYLKYKGKLYEPNIALFEVLDTSESIVISVEPTNYFEDDDHSPCWDDIQSSVINLKEWN